MDIILTKLRDIIKDLNSTQIILGGKDTFLTIYLRLKPIVKKGFGENANYLNEIDIIFNKTIEADSYISMPFYFESLEDVVIRMVDELEMNKIENSKRNENISDTSQDFWNILHPNIQKLARERFENGFYSDAVVSCLKEANSIIKKFVRAKNGRELDGAALMTTAFSVQNPLIKLADLETETGRNMQQGYMKIFEGAMIGIRNPKSHENFEVDRMKAIHFLFISSFIFIKLDDTGVTTF